MNIQEVIKQEGRLEGMEKGVLKGRQEGMQLGRQEERRQVICNMLREKADISFISKVTGSPEAEIIKLKSAD